jgi:hypothetical protein
MEEHMSDLRCSSAVSLLADPTEVGNLDNSCIQWLLRQGVSTGTIAGPWALRAGRVMFNQHDHRYRSNPIGEFALIVGVLVADLSSTMVDLDADDIVAWAPRSGRISTRLGWAFALGEEQIGIDGLGTTGLPIPVHSSPLDWLRADRRGLVLADWEMAAYALRGLILEAEDAAHRRDLERRLTPIAPRIVVASHRRRAA